MGSEQFSLATTILYISVVLFASTIAFLSYRKGYIIDDHSSVEPHINFAGMCIVFVILWALLAFSKCGSDYETYNMLFIRAKEWDFIVGYHRIEPLFAGINYIIRLMTNNVNIYNGIISFIYLFFVFKALYAQKHIINFGWGILAFTCCFYFQFMNLKRIYLASAIIFYALQYLISKKYLKYLFWVTVATLIHTSAIVMIILLLIELFVPKKMKYSQIIICTIGVLILIYIFRGQIIQIISRGRYANYELIQGGFGFAQIIYHVPLIWMLIREEFHSDKSRTVLFITLYSFLFGSMGYFIEAVGRTEVYFMFAFSYVASLGNIYQIREVPFGTLIINRQMMIKLFFLMYFVLRLYVYFTGLIYSDQIMPYMDIWGNIF